MGKEAEAEEGGAAIPAAKNWKRQGDSFFLAEGVPPPQEACSSADPLIPTFRTVREHVCLILSP